MPHCDDDVLALIALGEPRSTDDAAHLASCGRCQSRLDQLAAVVASARSISPEDHPVAPPASVWAAISEELAADDSVVVSLEAARRRRGRRTWVIGAIAAAIGILLGAVITGGIVRVGGTGDVVAQAELGPVASTGYRGTATVSRTAQGNVLTVSLPDLPKAADGYYEVWMATPDTKTMVAIGTLNPGGEARFTLPQGMDVTAFPVVDVSLETFDGDPGHSATSVARGQMPA